jgi:predicted amidohydrolase YtcJ
MYTNWAARYTGDEGDLGVIAPGKLADLVILDGDYMTVAPDQMSEMAVLATVIGGRVVYVDPAVGQGVGLSAP